MAVLTESDLHERFPWSKPVVPALTDQEKADGYFCDPQPWEFAEPVMRLIEEMLLEIEEYFAGKGVPAELAIYQIIELFGELHVEMFSPYQDVYGIVQKYTRLSRDLFADSDQGESGF